MSWLGGSCWRSRSVGPRCRVASTRVGCIASTGACTRSATASSPSKAVWMAAVLACGPPVAVLSHRCALALWDLRQAPSGAIEVTVRGQGKPGPKGVLVRRSRVLADVDAAEVDGIPVTSLPWTVVDYAAITNRRQVRLVLEALERRRIYIGRELDELLAAHPEPQGRQDPPTSDRRHQRTGAVAAVSARASLPRADPRVRSARARGQRARRRRARRCPVARRSA